MTGVDTNVLVRFLTRDHSEQYERAKTFLTSECTTDNPGYVNPIVLCEVVWVLKSAYKCTRDEIAGTLEMILQTRQLEIGDRDAVRLALRAYRDSGADFADCLIERQNQDAGCAETVTFDRDATTLESFRLI